MTIVGGTYVEFCFEPYWQEIYGSGLRACMVLLESLSDVIINYHTYGNPTIEQHCTSLMVHYSERLKVTVYPTTQLIRFSYDFPLTIPHITPRLDVVKAWNIPEIRIQEENILYFGMIEGTPEVHGKKVVYDPQSPVNPTPFTQTNSTAEQLLYVINYTEAKLISGKEDPSDIWLYFMNNEKCHFLVLKMGPKGAMIFGEKEDAEIVPVYKTKSVWPIGSGDVFSSIIAYYWFQGNSVYDSAIKASKATAYYCENKVLDTAPSTEDDFSGVELVVGNYPSKQVYLAGPFFTFTQRWLVHQIREALIDIGVKVFSPFHDVGLGSASDVVDKDLLALQKSELIFAIADGLDSGTVFEVGYAVAREIPVIAFVQNESDESLKMLEGCDCLLEKDLTTAIYKTFWILTSYE